MPRLSKKARREWNFFISPKTGRRTYNDRCCKCSNACKQSFKAVIVSCPKYRSKRSVKKHRTAINLTIQAKPKNDI